MHGQKDAGKSDSFKTIAKQRWHKNKKPLETVWPDSEAATKFQKIEWEQA